MNHLHNYLQIEHHDWLLQDFELFTRHKELEKAIIESTTLLENGDYNIVEEKIKLAVQISLQKDLGTNYWENPKERLLNIKSKNGQISTGWDDLDKLLYGGFNIGELNIFTGGSGAGKSLFLANLAVNWISKNLNVLYVTLELSEDLVAMRMDAMMTNVPTKDIFKNIDDIDAKIKIIAKHSGNLQIKYLPSGKCTNDVRSYAKEYEMKTNSKIDAIIIDYLDLLMPNSGKVSPAELFVKDKFVSEELRNFAMEKKCILVTASQLNRSAVDEVEFDHSHIAGGISKIQTADNVFAIFTSKHLRDQEKYQLQLLKTRSSSGVGQKIELNYDTNSLRISNNTTTMSNTPTSILDKIKQRDTVKPIIKSNTLRQMINNLPDDQT